MTSPAERAPRTSRRIGMARTGAALLLTLGAAAACGSPPPPPPAPAAPAPPASTAEVPGDVLDLSNWYLTLPTGTGEDPDEVHQPQLATFTNDWFQLDEAREGVVFRANAGGATTEGSDYPRSELREMKGTEKASWSNTSGTHTMTIRQAVTALPEVKQHVVTAQIHDGESDVVEVRLEKRKLIAQYADGEREFVIDDDYVLGTPYDLTITAADGSIEVAYNGEVAGEIPQSGTGWYFKSGSYVQTNPERGDSPDAIGEVVLYSLTVEHSE